MKIADFGLATFLDKQTIGKLHDKCGTPSYVAPEILRGYGYNYKCDIFSLGSMLFNMITGRFLFNGTDKNQILYANKVCDLSYLDSYLLA